MRCTRFRVNTSFQHISCTYAAEPPLVAGCAGSASDGMGEVNWDVTAAVPPLVADC